MDIIDKAKASLQREVTSIEKRTDLTDDQKVTKICTVFSTTCAAIAVQPIPFADIFILTPIQAFMGKKIADIRGYNISEAGAAEIFKELASVVGLGFLSQQLVIGAYKTVLPFLGAITTIPLVFGLTYGMGNVMNYYFEKKVKGQKIDADILKSIFNKAKAEGKQKAKEHEKDIKRREQNFQSKNTTSKHAKTGSKETTRIYNESVSRSSKKQNPILAIQQKIKKRNYEEAFEDCIRLINQKPNSAELYFLLGIIHFKKDRRDEARKAYDQAVQLHPDYDDAYIERGKLEMADKNYLIALNYFTEAIKMNSKSIRAYYWRGLAKQKLNWHKEAISDFSEVLKLEPNNLKANRKRSVSKNALEIN